MQATFTCNATGRPRPTIAWYRVEFDSTHMLLHGNQSTEVSLGSTEIFSTLIIDDNSPSDATDYVCVATNLVNTSEMSATLIVHGKLT